MRKTRFTETQIIWTLKEMGIRYKCRKENIYHKLVKIQLGQFFT